MKKYMLFTASSHKAHYSVFEGDFNTIAAARTAVKDIDTPASSFPKKAAGGVYKIINTATNERVAGGLTNPKCVNDCCKGKL